MMKKWNRICISLALVLAMLLQLPVGAAAGTVGRYDVASEGIVSGYYAVDAEKGYLTGIAPGTAAKDVLKVCLPADAVCSQELAGTGATITAGDKSLTVIVTGDLNGDANVTITDMLMVKSHLLGEELSGAAAVAGDVNYDGNVSITDFLQLKAVLLGLGTISTRKPAGTYAEGTMVLMTPGSTQSWDAGIAAGGASFASDDDSIAAIDAAGMLSAGVKEGSTFVYALAADGAVIARTQITVLSDPLKVTLEKDRIILQKGQTTSVATIFNHPVTAPITWSSADPSIASVGADGAISGVNYGITTVTATLPNGNYAEVQISVAPPIEKLEIGKSLYKVKPGHTKALDLTVAPLDSGEEFVWSSSDTAIATVSADGVVTGVSYGTVTITVTGKYSGLSASCQVKICDVKQVAFTFDDGPSKQTARLLDFLKENDIKVTFFLVCNMLPYYEDTVKRQAAEGHEIGYHSYNHAMQYEMTSEAIIKDFNWSNNKLKELTGQEFTVWRAPGGGYSDRVLSCIPLPHIMWSVDTLDWKTLNATKVYNEIMNKATDGSIILMHDLYASTVDGAIWAMQQMMEGDYEFLTVTELLSRDGTPPEKGQSYNKG